MTDWAKRAQELTPLSWNAEGRDECARVALQLGQEMADARAEEIAKRLDEASNAEPYHKAAEANAYTNAARIARSFISKPEPLSGVDRERLMRGEWPKGETADEAAIRADEREKCAQELLRSFGHSLYCVCAGCHARRVLEQSRASEGKP